MSFESSLSIAVELEDEVNKLTRVISLNLLRSLVKLTPVDTGRAKGNWFVSSSERSNRSLGEFRRARQAITAGTATIHNVINQRYPTITISNNLPYIEKLEQGSSDQAPAGFVELALQRIKNARFSTSNTS